MYSPGCTSSLNAVLALISKPANEIAKKLFENIFPPTAI
jgi:hypothetical protein